MINLLALLKPTAVTVCFFAFAWDVIKTCIKKKTLTQYMISGRSFVQLMQVWT